ncbi:heme exporter protein CcmD [Candidatus Phycosocius spiralis]|nr:heme exporter protein CcmD [Candidatus Phycosocius spiralis]
MRLQFTSLQDFFAMGGYAGFVFGAWGLSALVIACLIARAIIQGKRNKARLADLRKAAPHSKASDA